MTYALGLRRVNLGFGVAFAITLAVGIYSNFNSSSTVKASRARLESGQRRLYLENLLSALKDAETGQQGFLITGDDSYLLPFERAKASYQTDLQVIQPYYEKEQKSRERLMRLQKLVDAKFAEISKTIDLKKSGKIEAALAAVRTHNGKKIMDEIRGLLLEFSTEEDLLWKQKTIETSETIAQGNFISLTSSFLTFVLILISWIYSRLKVRDSYEAGDRLSAVVNLQYEIAAGGTDIDRLMHLVVVRAEKLTKATGAVIEMAEGDDMVYRSASGAAMTQLGLRLKREHSLTGKSVETGEILVCEDALTDPRVDREACIRVGLRSMVVMPLRHSNTVVGVLKVYSSRPNAFQARHVATLELMSGFLGIMFDRSKSLEAMKIAEQTALEASRLKSEFLANMSHEIRTPINGVVGMVSMLLDTPLSEIQKIYTSNIARSADNLLTLVNDILDLSKAESGKIDLENIDFDFEQLLENVESTLSLSAKQKGLQLIRQIPPDFPRFLRGDPTRVQQVLTNLVNNAIKFTAKGTVSINVSSESAALNQHKITIEVKDTGTGIPKRSLQKIFEAFTQADSSTTRRFGGTGLGLSISKRLVDFMGGTIGVESEEGHGSRFWFTLNFSSAENTQTITPTTQPPVYSGKRLRVLLAEDNTVNQMIALSMLKKMGHSGVAVANGNEVLDALREASYYLVLMDCQMPEMDGYEATRTIRSNDSLNCKNIKIVAMTANAMAGDREKCIAAGMNDYITKPVKLSDLHSVIERVMELDQRSTG